MRIWNEQKHTAAAAETATAVVTFVTVGGGGGGGGGGATKTILVWWAGAANWIVLLTKDTPSHASVPAWIAVHWPLLVASGTLPL